MKRPKGWRKGQYYFNLLEFMREEGVSTNQNARLADPFHISDEEWDRLEKKFRKRLTKIGF